MNRRVWTALLTVQILFAVHYVVAKILLEDIPPRSWALIRVAASASVLLGASHALRRSFPKRLSEYGKLALYALFGVGINQFCFVEGLSRTTPTHSAIINTTIPVLTLAFAVALGRETATPTKIASLVIALAGVSLVVAPWTHGFSEATVQGDLLTVLNATSFSIFLVLSRRIMMRVDPLPATALMFCFGAIYLLPVGWPTLAEIDMSDLNLQHALIAVFIVLGPTAGAYLLNSWALGKVHSSMVALFIYLQPVLTSILSFVILAEPIGMRLLIGALLIFIGVRVASTDRSLAGRTRKK